MLKRCPFCGEPHPDMSNVCEHCNHDFLGIYLAQLTELGLRTRWYSAQLWQIPFAYLGLTGIALGALAASATVSDLRLGVAFLAATGFGLLVTVHVVWA